MGKGLPGAESQASISCSSSKVSPMVSSAGEWGGVSVTGTGHLEFSLSTEVDTSGEEGIKGVKSLHSPGSLSLSEGIRFTATLPILIFRQC